MYVIRIIGGYRQGQSSRALSGTVGRSADAKSATLMLLSNITKFSCLCNLNYYCAANIKVCYINYRPYVTAIEK